MKPVIALTANYITDDSVGLAHHIGVKFQEYQLLSQDYVTSIEQSGATPLILPVLEHPEDLLPILQSIQGIIFTGGSDLSPFHYGESAHEKLGPVIPQRDRMELDLLKLVLEKTDLPVLCICRGLQVLNVLQGGTLYQHIPEQKTDAIRHSVSEIPKHYPSHTVTLQKDTKTYQIFQKEQLGVNTFHHQGIRTLGNDLQVTMKAPDGMVEGVEMLSRENVIALQWHPEMMFSQSDDAKTLFRAFIRLAEQS